MPFMPGRPLNVADLQQPNPLSMDFIEAGVQAGHAHNRDFNGHSQEGVGLYQVTQRGGERCSAAKAYLTPFAPQLVAGAHGGTGAANFIDANE